MSACLAVLEASFSARLERWGMCISKEERSVGAAEFVYEGNMNALAVDVYAGCMLTSGVKTCFSAGGKIHANLLPREICTQYTQHYLTSSASF